MKSCNLTHTSLFLSWYSLCTMVSKWLRSAFDKCCGQFLSVMDLLQCRVLHLEAIEVGLERVKGSSVIFVIGGASTWES
jgi:hypothetical protein